MIFSKTWQQVLDGTKTQTRRLVREGEKFIDKSWGWPTNPMVITGNYHTKWQVGRTYAVQPGRGKKAVGRFRLTDIRREQLQDISPTDARAEGIKRTCSEWGPAWFTRPDGKDGEFLASVSAFKALWDSIHGKGDRWIDNPEIWVLEFRLVAGAR